MVRDDDAVPGERPGAATIGTGWRRTPSTTVRVRALNGEDAERLVAVRAASARAPGRTPRRSSTTKHAHDARALRRTRRRGGPWARPVSADDANDDELTYTLEGGPDAGSFGIDSEDRAAAHERGRSTTSRRRATQLTVKADDERGRHGDDRGDGERDGRRRAAAGA